MHLCLFEQATAADNWFPIVSLAENIEVLS